jgi:hypothetical protein
VLLASAVGFLVGAVGAAFTAGADEEGEAPRRSLSDRFGSSSSAEKTGDNAGVQILDKPAEA